MQLTELNQRLADLGAKPQHIGRITRAWLQGKPLDTGTKHQKTENFLPLTVREALPAIASELDALARLRSEHPGADGSARLLVELAGRIPAAGERFLLQGLEIDVLAASPARVERLLIRQSAPPPVTLGQHTT